MNGGLTENLWKVGTVGGVTGMGASVIPGEEDPEGWFFWVRFVAFVVSALVTWLSGRASKK